VKKLSLLLLITLCLSNISIYSQHERKKKLSNEENILNEFSKSAIMDSTTLDSTIVAHMNTYHIPGLTALINTKDDGIIWKRSYGYANLETQQTVEDSTLFLIASISKTIIVTAIMQFGEADSFDLDDDINNYLEGFQVINPFR
jgi:CubicO group peptidase (beta-lactamase class C family)